MGLRAFRAVGVVVVSAIAGLWIAGGTQHEKPLLAATAFEAVRGLEANAAARPDDPEATRALAQGYVDARQPGLALALYESSPETTRGDVRLRHVYGRALVDEGRNAEALAVEDEILAECTPLVNGAVVPRGCDPVLLASAVRRTGILSELVRIGVSDAQAYPEASRVAYRNATREARVAWQ